MTYHFVFVIRVLISELGLLLPLADHPDHVVRVGREHCAGDEGVVCLDALPEVVAVAPHRRELGVVVVRLPDVDALVLRAAHDILPVVREGRLDLAGHVDVAFVFTGEVEVPEVVQSDPAVVGGDEDLVVIGHGFDPADLAAGGVLPSGRSHVDLCVVLELVGGVEDAAAVVRAHHGELPVLAEVGGCYQLGFAIHFVPHRDLRTIC